MLNYQRDRMLQNFSGTSSRIETPLKRWLIPDIETWSPLHLCQDAAHPCGLLYLHQNLGISHFHSQLMPVGCLKFRNYKWWLTERTADYRLRAVLSFLMPCPTKVHLQFLSDWNGRHQLLGKIIAQQNDPLFPNSPSKNGFVLLWGFFVYFFSQTATFIPNHKFMTISLAQQQTRTWDRSHELWAASQNTTEILLQGLLSKSVCGLDTSLKTLFFCKTNSVINTTHQDFVLMAG